jgi:predicted PurR-regulated permease PerM
MPRPTHQLPDCTKAAWALSALGLLLILVFHLLPALFAGMMVYELVHLMKPAVKRRTTDRRKTLIAVAVLAGLVVAMMTAAIIGVVGFFNSDAGSVSALVSKMAEIIQSSRATMPTWLATQIPDQPADLEKAAAQWLHAHADVVRLAGAEVGRALLYVSIGMIIGALIALHAALPVEPRRPLATALVARVSKLALAFRRVVFAQISISLLNTLFSGLYLALILPLLGVDLPLKKTLIAITFIAGLFPVIGNLVSNTAIVIVSLSYSWPAATASLVFLIVIHKFEYFLNARIIGVSIESRAWELLVAMLALEAVFGIYGLIAAPIYYAYVKDELVEQGLI